MRRAGVFVAAAIALGVAACRKIEPPKPAAGLARPYALEGVVVAVDRAGGKVTRLATAVISPDGKLLSLRRGNDWEPKDLVEDLKRAAAGEMPPVVAASR